MEKIGKRVRPSVTAYRELEKELESQIDGTSRLVKDCDLWREKYRGQLLAGKYLSDQVKDLKAQLSAQELYATETVEQRGLMSRLFNALKKIWKK